MLRNTFWDEKKKEEAMVSVHTNVFKPILKDFSRVQSLTGSQVISSKGEVGHNRF